MVLSKTRGNSKSTVPMNGINQEVWKYSRNEVLDIIGVGWKVDGDDEANRNALALFRPERYATYPHKRVLVKWKDGHITLEHRASVRRIANGNSFNGDRMIYMKAKELEDAYWGYDVEEYWNQDSDSGDNMSSEESRRLHRRTSPGKHFTKSRRGVRFTESEQESDTDSETSQSSLDRAQTMRRLKRHSSVRKSRSSQDVDMDAKIRSLKGQLKRLQVKQQRSSRGNQTVSQSRRRKNHG